MRGSFQLGLAVGLLLALTSCSTTAQPIAPTMSQPPSAQKFQTKSEAVAAAQTVYKGYLKAADSVAKAGGEGVEALTGFVTSDELKQEQASAADLQRRKLRIVGSSKLVEFKYQNANLQTGSVNAYTCVDFSEARVLDAGGKDVTPSKRVDRQTSIAKFVWQDNDLRLQEISAWSGDSLC